jgi:hypothetical protein
MNLGVQQKEGSVLSERLFACQEGFFSTDLALHTSKKKKKYMHQIKLSPRF